MNIYILPLLLAFLTTACEKKVEHPQQDVLKIATSADNPPYEFYKDGKLTGFDIELAEAIAHKMHKKAVFTDIPFDSIMASLQSQKVDMAIAGFTPTEDRRRAVDFSVAYHDTTFVLVTPGLTDVHEIKDLEGKIVGAQLGSSYETYGNSTLKKTVAVSIQTLSKLTDLIQNLKIGRIDGLIVGIPEAGQILASNKSFKVIKLPDSSDSKSIALPKGSDLTAKVDDAIDSLKKDGTLGNLYMKWNIK